MVDTLVGFGLNQDSVGYTFSVFLSKSEMRFVFLISHMSSLATQFGFEIIQRA
jgi:hypothetical protein